MANSPEAATSAIPGKMRGKSFGMGMSRELAELLSFWGGLALVASLIVGVIATWLTVVSANSKEEYLRRDVAEANAAGAAANERARKAEQSASEAMERAERERIERLKLEAQVAPRRLTADQQRAIAESLSPFAGRAVVVKSYALDVEGAVFSLQIVEALRAANLNVFDRRLSDGPLGEVALGIHVSGSDKALVERLVGAISSRGQFSVLSSERPPPQPAGISTGEPVLSAAATVFVGAKPITQKMATATGVISFSN